MAITRREFIWRTFLVGGSLFLAPATLQASQIKKGGWRAAYLKLEKEGRLAQRIEQAYAILENCEL